MNNIPWIHSKAGYRTGVQLSLCAPTHTDETCFFLPTHWHIETSVYHVICAQFCLLCFVVIALSISAEQYGLFTQIFQLQFGKKDHMERQIWMVQLQQNKAKPNHVHIVWYTTLRLRQNGRQFADDTFKCIFLNGNVRISIKIPLKFVRKGPINNIPKLVQIVAWRWPGDKPLFELMLD